MSFYGNPFPSSCYMNGINMDKDRQDEYFKMKVLESLRNQGNGKCTHCKRCKSPEDEEDYGTDSESDSDCGTDLSSATHGQGSVSKKAKSKKKRTSVKPGIPEDSELHHLAEDVIPFWKKLGRELGVEERKLSQLQLDYQQDAYERAFQMLLHWRQTRNDQATYQILYNALTSAVVGRIDLGKKYCELT